MKATYRAAVSIKGQALLGDLGLETWRHELLPTPDAREEAALGFSSSSFAALKIIPAGSFRFARRADASRNRHVQIRCNTRPRLPSWQLLSRQVGDPFAVASDRWGSNAQVERLCDQVGRCV